jgi:hypothetical protein
MGPTVCEQASTGAARRLRHSFLGECMLAVSVSRAIPTLIVPLLCLVGFARGDDPQVQSLPIQTAAAADAGPAEAEDSRIILTAGQQTAAEDAPRPEVTTVSTGTSSRRARSTAIDELGLHRLPQPNQQLVQGVIDEISLFRRLPSFRCEVDPQVHDYFVHHPDVAVSIWRAMGISEVELSRTGDWTYGMDTNDGTTGRINVLYRSRESCLILCSGMFKSPFLQAPIAARSVMHVRTQFSTDQQGRTFATHQADMFVSFPSQKIETVAKLISPVSNVIVDRNFQEISLFIHVMWLAMGRQPGWVEQIVGQLEGVTEEQRQELIKLTARVYVDTQTALRRRNGEPVSLDAIRPPTSGNSTQPVSTTRRQSENADR